MASASKSNLDIREDDLGGVQVGALLREHLESVVLHSPPESVHALDVEAYLGQQRPDPVKYHAVVLSPDILSLVKEFQCLPKLLLLPRRKLSRED